VAHDQETKDKCKAKAKAVKDKADLLEKPIVRRTRYGEVQIGTVTVVTDAEGLDRIEVWLRGATQSGDPHFRIYNPPLLAEDATGPVEVNGRRYREDPVTAVAEVIARHGGARKKGRRR